MTADEPGPRRGWLAALLSLLQSGLGHMYAGRLRRGALLLAASWAFVPLAAHLIRQGFTSMLVALAMQLAVSAAVAADAALCCRGARFVPKRYNQGKWYVAAYAATGVLGAVFFSPYLQVSMDCVPFGCPRNPWQTRCCRATSFSRTYGTTTAAAPARERWC